MQNMYAGVRQSLITWTIVNKNFGYQWPIVQKSQRELTQVCNKKTRNRIIKQVMSFTEKKIAYSMIEAKHDIETIHKNRPMWYRARKWDCKVA